MNTNKRKEIKMQYKMTERPIGVYKISNSESEKVFIGKSMNLDGAINACRFQLKNNVHKNKNLQDEWNKLGGENFVFDIMEKIESPAESGKDPKDELNNLEEIWFNKLQPYVEKEYK